MYTPMGSSPSIIEANENLDRYVGAEANLWNNGNKVYLSISPNTMITTTVQSEKDYSCSGQLIGLQVSEVEQHVPSWFGFVRVRKDYLLTVRFLNMCDQVISSPIGFTLEEKMTSVRRCSLHVLVVMWVKKVKLIRTRE